MKWKWFVSCRDPSHYCTTVRAPKRAEDKHWNPCQSSRQSTRPAAAKRIYRFAAIPCFSVYCNVNPLKPWVIIRVCTTRFNSQYFFILPTQHICVSWGSQNKQTPIISPYSINWFVFTPEAESVHCAVRTGSLTIIQIGPLFTANSMHTIYFIYIYIYRERERERERVSPTCFGACAPSSGRITMPVPWKTN